MTSDANALFEFVDDTTPQNTYQESVKVLTVEDDANYQNALVSSLNSITVDHNIKLEILTAQSVMEAALVLSRNNDIAIVFIDVVMEEDDSGLRLVNTIRNVIGNREMRIVLLTGQPSFAPERDVMASLDIDEYWNKADLSIEKLQSIINTNLRTYNYISQISSAKNGLQLILDAARTINSKHDLASFSSAVLCEIAKIVNISDGGGVLCSGNGQNLHEPPQIISAMGCFKHLAGQHLSDNLLEQQLYRDVQNALTQKTHIFSAHHSVFYFDTPTFDHKHYLTIVKSDNPISEQNIYLFNIKAIAV